MWVYEKKVLYTSCTYRKRRYKGRSILTSKAEHCIMKLYIKTESVFKGAALRRCSRFFIQTKQKVACCNIDFL